MGFPGYKTFLLVVVVCALQQPATVLTKSKQVSRIVDGEIELFIPHQLSLQVYGRHFCGASLVQVQNIQLAVTAAHCVFQRVHLNIVLVAGEVDLSDTSGLEQTRQVAKIIVHEDYSPFEHSNNLALLFFNEPFKLNDFVAVASFPNELQESFENVAVSGWSYQQSAGRSPNRLQKIRTSVIGPEECKAAWQPYVEITDDMICTESLCHGDRGGLATGKGDDVDYLVGVFSFGNPSCNQKDLPAVFTKVAKYVGWIELIVENELTCCNNVPSEKIDNNIM